jgi:hypothetical protein
MYCISWSDALQTICSVATLLVALYALTTWRKELHEKQNHDLALRILRSCDLLTISFDSLRVRLLKGLDGRKTVAPRGPSIGIKVYEQRYKEFATAIVDLQATLIDAKILWKVPAVEWHNNLHKLLLDVKHSLGEHVDYVHSDAEIRAIIVDDFYPKDDGTDPLGDKITACINEISKIAEEYLSKPKRNHGQIP